MDYEVQASGRTLTINMRVEICAAALCDEEAAAAFSAPWPKTSPHVQQIWAQVGHNAGAYYEAERIPKAVALENQIQRLDRRIRPETAQSKFISGQPTIEKRSRKGPKNLLSRDQSVMAKTMSENAPANSFSIAFRKSVAVRCGSFSKAPQPHAPRTRAA